MADLEANLIANTRQFQKAASQDVPAALRDTSDALDDVVRDVERGGERMERTFRDLAQTADRQTRDMSRDVERNSERGFDRAKEHVGEFKDEARQNFAEVASSFDGSVQGIADGIQGTLGGLAGSIAGPVGLVAGALGAVGGAFLQQWVDRTEAVEERVSAMYDDMLESGLNYLSQDQMNRALAELGEDTRRYNEALEIAKGLNLDVNTVLIAEVAAGRERNLVLERAGELYGEYSVQARNARDVTDSEAQKANEWAGYMAAVVERYQGLNTEQGDALSKVQQIRAAQEAVNGQFTEGVREATKINDALTTIPNQIGVVLTVDDSAIDRAIAKPRPALKLNVEGYVERGGKRVI